MSKWTKGRPHTSLGFINVDLEAKVGTYSRIFSTTIGPSAEIETEAEGITIIGIVIGSTIGTGLEIIIDLTVVEIAINLMFLAKQQKQTKL